MVFAIAGVGALVDGAASRRLDHVYGFPTAVVVDVGDDDGGAIARISHGDGSADAGRAAGDDGDLAGEKVRGWSGRGHGRSP